MGMDIRRLAAPTSWDVIERLMHDQWPPLASGRGEGGATTTRQVPLNAWEAQDGYHVALLAPGADPEAISVTAVGGTLTVEGELKVETPPGAKHLWQEFGPSRFRRTIQLPDAINAEGVEAYYKNGLLLITVPKAEHAKPRSIAVKPHGPGAQPVPTEAPKGKPPAG
jgi:HSP20 family protein